MSGKTCIVCSSPAEKKCSSCHSTNYCSREHQKIHWKQHKYQCTPTRVKQDEKVGRYLEATKEIKAGDVVIREKPLITGPSLGAPPVCIGCYKLLEEGQLFPCSKCGLPACSEKCSLKTEHEPECYYTQKRGEGGNKVFITTIGVLYPLYTCIIVLRCLYQRDHNPKLWEKLQGLQSQCEDRKGTEEWKEGVVFFIWKFFKLEKTFSEEEIMRCCGIIQINGYEMPEMPLVGAEYVAVFDRLSMAEHNCRANCSKIFTSEGNLLLVACMPIPLGAHITVCYTDPLWGTEARRIHLSENWSFECNCDRCSDATEFGTSYSAVKCQNEDCKGYLLPTTFILPILKKTKNPDLDNKFWICSACKDEVPDAVIQQLLMDIGKILFFIKNKKDLDACERFISYCSSYLHPNHYYMTEANVQALNLLTGLGYARLSKDRLIWKTKLCKKLLELFEVVAPAEKKIRGFILCDLHTAILETGERQALVEGPTAYLGYIIEAHRNLVESVRLLRYELIGQRYESAKRDLAKIDKLIKSLSSFTVKQLLFLH